MRRSKTKRKTAKKSTPRRRKRRVSGVFGSSDMMDILLLMGGGIVAREANNIIQKTFTGVSPTVVAVGQIAAGVMLPNFVKAGWAKSLGQGMIVIGGTQVAVSLGVISGTGSRMQSYRIAGKGNLNAIAGTSNLLAVNGAPISQPAKKPTNIGSFA